MAKSIREELCKGGRIARRTAACTCGSQDKSAEESLVLEQSHGRVSIRTSGPGFMDITRQVAAWLTSVRAGNGIVTLFIRHTSASLTIQENADPDVLRDLTDALDRAAPRHACYRHTTEGPDDMPGHIKSMLTATSLSIPVEGGRMVLGTWQAVYLIEHRDSPHTRELALHYVGTRS